MQTLDWPIARYAYLFLLSHKLPGEATRCPRPTSSPPLLICRGHHPRRDRRRLWLRRPGTGPVAGPPSPRPADAGDRIAGQQHAAPAAGAGAHLGRRGGAARPRAVGRAAEIVFLALPEAASAEVAPHLLAGGARVIDLSGAFRLRDDAARARVVPGDQGAARRRRLRPDRVRSAPRSPAPRWCRVRAAIRRRRCWRCSRSPRPACCAATPTSSSTPSRASRAPARPRPTARTSARTTAASLPTACSAIATRRRWRRRSAATSPSRRISCRSIAACSRRSTRGSRPAPPRRRSPMRSPPAYAASPFVRLTGETLPEIKHVAWTNFCDIGWRVDAATGRIILVSVHRQPGEGRRRTGRPELQPAARRRRAHADCCEPDHGAQVRRRAARRPGADQGAGR